MANPDFTIADVLAWARTKPADEEYAFIDASACALGQFARRHGMSKVDAGCQLYRRQFGDAWKDLYSAALAEYRRWPSSPDQTFGGFVTRLETLLGEAPAVHEAPEPGPSEWTKLDAYMADIEMARS